MPKRAALFYDYPIKDGEVFGQGRRQTIEKLTDLYPEVINAKNFSEHALKLGDGYEIHGTLYPHLLGRHITHGCIRLNDEDLKSAYTLTGLDNRVYIY